MKIEQIIKIRKELFKANKPNKMEEGDMENPCWEG